jgi:predicted house-cleaning noncanonical NTP pyrophosphatase (MazG superfamily)
MDNFDLTKFLKESKALENLNPTFKSLNENKHVKDKIKEMILAELGNSDKKVNEYDSETPAYNNSSPHGPGYEMDRYREEMAKRGIETDSEGKPTTNNSNNENKHVKDKIKEMILAELSEDTATDEAYDPVYENELEEAKKDEEEEDIKMTDVETEDAPEEDAPEEDAPEEDADEAPATGGGLEDIAADMEGTEGDLMDALMKSLKIAKGMGNEKLETQIGNTLKFFVSEYIGGGE